MNKKYIVVTGGVISGIGKGVTGASTGFFLTDNYKITPMKLDGYLNVDPGTMNPHEHGEVFVLSDGAEVDMDFGHYERFLGVESKKNHSISMGKIFSGILEKERRGDFLGKTVQMIPHVTGYIIDTIEKSFKDSNGDICLIEVGGTVGDIEAELYFEAIRQMRRNKDKNDFIHIHLSYVPIPAGVMEQKTKPTQQSINLLQSRGLFPDIIIVRCREPLTTEAHKKISCFSNLRSDSVFSAPDVSSIYTVPEILHTQGLDKKVHQLLDLPYKKTKKLDTWNKILKNSFDKKVKIGIVGKYTALEDSYSSVVEAIKHVGSTLNADIEITFINTRGSDGIKELKDYDGCIVPGGFGDTAIENMLTTLRYIRENKIPCLGICLGMQLMVIEYARNVLGIKDANSLEFVECENGNDVITLLDEQKNIVHMGGTMRLGKQHSIVSDSQTKKLYTEAKRISKKQIISERFRHRYEVHPDIGEKLNNTDLQVVAKSENEGIVQFIEMKKKTHPYYIGTQSHPELTSKLENPAPLFMGLIKSCLK